MTTFQDIINETQFRTDPNADLIHLANRALRTIAKRLYVLGSKIIEQTFSIPFYASVDYTATTIAFVASPPGITDSASQFVVESFMANTYLESDQTANLGPFRITTVAAGTLTLATTDVVVGAIAGPSVTLTSVSEYMDLPTDFWGLTKEKPWEVGKTYPLVSLPENSTRLQFTGAGSPIYYEVLGLKLYLTPAPATNTTIKGKYFAAPTLLVDGTSSMPYNGLFDDAVAELITMLYKNNSNPNIFNMVNSFITKNVDLIAAKWGNASPVPMPGGIEYF